MPFPRAARIMKSHCLVGCIMSRDDKGAYSRGFDRESCDPVKLLTIVVLFVVVVKSISGRCYVLEYEHGTEVLRSTRSCPGRAKYSRPQVMSKDIDILFAYFTTYISATKYTTLDINSTKFVQATLFLPIIAILGCPSIRTQGRYNFQTDTHL